MTQGKTLVFDVGASSIKVGFAGSLSPVQVIPTIIGAPRRHFEKHITKRNLLLGEDALRSCDYKNMVFRYPIDEKGSVQDWSSLTYLLQHAVHKVGIDECSIHKALITKPYNMKKTDIKRLVDIFFQKLGFGAVTMHDQAALVLYTQGVDTGIVVELGDSLANIVPVYKGHAIPKLDKQMPIGGRTISMYLTNLIQRRGYQLDSREDLEIVREIKEKSCYVALEPDIEERLSEETTVLVETFHLKDGSSISLGRERFGATEAIFQPKLWDSEKSGLADLIFETIQEADIDCRVDLYQNIILSGGMSLLPGIRQRLEKDLNHRYNLEVLKGDDSRSRKWELKVHSPSSREHLVYEGVALFADLIGNESHFWVTRANYEEHGAQLVLDKYRIT